jgi:hypothetical protein
MIQNLCLQFYDINWWKYSSKCETECDKQIYYIYNFCVCVCVWKLANTYNSVYNF